MATVFPAKYSGLCIPCGEDIVVGESITNHPEAGYVHEECVEHVGKVAESHGADFDSFVRGRASGIAVLPRGKTGKDKCMKCFMVHSPGQDGCE